MNAILSIPLGLRLFVLFALGTLVGGFINLAIYRLAWNRRLISPWSVAPPGSSRRWPDRLPLIGWFRLRRETSLHGPRFWVRPLAVEIATGLLFAGLYVWETERAVPFLLFPAGQPLPVFLNADLPLVAHVRFASHLVLVALMLAASLIDMDEKTIPDAITVAGTIIGLGLAVVVPWTLLPAMHWIVAGVPQVELLTFVSPGPWPDALGGWPRREPLAIALGCWTLWCGGLAPRRWNMRRGFATAVRVFFHRLRAERVTYGIAVLWLAGCLALALAAWLAPPENWATLLTALVGMAAGGGIIWAVRIVGGLALGQEAMGFGDVTLMAMIGSFIGWQGALIVFFLAPFAGLVIGLLQWIVHRDNEIPYGPFLCLATLVVIVFWNDLWDRTSDIFALGSLLVAALTVCLVLMGAMLLGFRAIRERAAPN